MKSFLSFRIRIVLIHTWTPIIYILYCSRSRSGGRLIVRLAYSKWAEFFLTLSFCQPAHCFLFISMSFFLSFSLSVFEQLTSPVQIQFENAALLPVVALCQ